MFWKSELEKELRKFLSAEQIIYYKKEKKKLKNNGLAITIYFNSKNRKCNMVLLYSELGTGLYLEIGLKEYRIVKLFYNTEDLFYKLNNLIVDNFQEMTKTQTINGA